MTSFRFLAISIITLSLCSCGIVRAPFKVAGGVAKGTASLSRAAVTKPMEAHKKRKANKEVEKRQRETKEAAARDAGPSLGGNSGFGSNPTFGTGGTKLPDPMESDPTVGSDPLLPVPNE
ncbi:hypothetical protein [Haloferula rosea]|uniref:Lipoprotein n=1 Tax=Haloferula rosea TaxID=490093 RepID=A0A934R9R1_9BACT|nr:hypothetical protein [Haloferula rosea]MBK1825399.1 hypothetical protein [Haloferula rosea]